MLWMSFFAPHDIYGFRYMRDQIVPRRGIRPPANLDDDLSGKPAIQRRYLDGGGNGSLAKTMDAETWRRYLMLYYQFIEYVDGHLGRMMDLLEQLGVLDETAIVYLSDHGDMAGGHGLALKGPCMYDELLKVPLTVSCPRRLPAGARCDRMVSLLDLVPTLCELGGVEPPPQAPGRSLTGALDGRNWREEVFAEFHSHLAWETPIRTVRTPDWKLSDYLLSGQRELYDLQSDPGELRNLAGDPAHAAAEKRLALRLMQWRREIDDAYLSGDRDPKAFATPPGPKARTPWR